MNVVEVSAAEPTRFVRSVSHNVANTKHRALEAILLGGGCHGTEASSGLREDGECLEGRKGQVGFCHRPGSAILPTCEESAWCQSLRSAEDGAAGHQA